MKEEYLYEAFITRVVDGDTVDAEIDLGFGITFKERLRIFDYDAPETWRPKTAAEKQHGLEATSQAKILLEENHVLIRTHSDKKGKYGRYLAEIECSEGDYATVMKRDGFSKRESYED